jgi:hypothetical protein
VAPSTVTWTASATGGTSPYTYSWTGSDGLAGNTSSVSKLYSSAGVYFATTTVRDSASTTLIVSCPGTLSNAGSPGDTVIGGCTSNCGKTIVSGAIAGVCGGADGLSFADATALNSANLCYYQGSVATPSSFSGNGPWSWTCSGINGSATSSPTCTATKSAVSDPSLNCTFGTKASSTVNVNTNTVWTVNPPACSTCTRTWSIIEGTQNNPPNGTVSGNTINHIFTTIGLKEVRVTFSTTTGGIPRSGSCTATTTVVQTGGGTQEI